MKNFVIVIAALLLYTSTAEALTLQLNKKQQSDVALEVCYQLLHAMDWYTTVNGVHNGWKEVNPVIGKYPSDLRMHGYFAASSVAHAAVIYLSPAEYRTVLQSFSIGVKSGLVNHNQGNWDTPRNNDDWMFTFHGTF